jgi:hypothetical protein
MRAKTIRGGAAVSPRQPRATLQPVKPAKPAKRGKDDRYVVQESRSVRSPWVWRAFLIMSLVAFGVVIILLGNGKTSFAAAWAVIACGWLAVSMWLWRQHHNSDQ